MILALPLLLLSASPAAAATAPRVNTAGLVAEMADLGRLARLPEVPYETLQFSSYDRRSTGPEEPGWFSNADGFGSEPIPGFLEVLEEPVDGVGLYLVADVDGPGAVVRGWSAGMDGTLEVFLDGADAPVFSGTGYDFLARRSARFLADAGLALDAGDAFVQEDADYFPVPFARHLRVTWRGRLDQLHFYHLNVRRYRGPVAVETFTPAAVGAAEAAIRATVAALLAPAAPAGETTPWSATVAPRATAELLVPGGGSRAIVGLDLAVQAADVDRALRGSLLRIAFDGSQRPQVEAPLGDFFGTGPGVNPYASLPFTVDADGTMHCRFVMPYRESARLELRNTTAAPVELSGRITTAPWTFDERSLLFRARWRNFRDLVSPALENVMDLPYVLLRGQGRVVGVACMVTNPAAGPFQGGNWWGEGDEKVFVDDAPFPAWFGTGSEDFYNYSWSRPDLFDHPYCGQPLDSGPATAGRVSNHRFLILDDLSFTRSILFSMELWQHNPSPGLGYAALAWAYARPGAVDDHRALTGTDLELAPFPAVEPAPLGAARGAVILFPEDLEPAGVAHAMTDLDAAPRNRLLTWVAAPGEGLTLTLPVAQTGTYDIHLVTLFHPGGPDVEFLLDGAPVPSAGLGESVALRTAHVPRVLNVDLKRVELTGGDHRLELRTRALATSPGAPAQGSPALPAGMVGVDYLWVKPAPGR